MKRVFRKKSLVETPNQGLSVGELGLSGGFRQQVNTPVTMLGLALSVGASASLVSVPGSALAAEGSAILVLPAASGTLQESAPAFSPVAADGSATTYYTVNDGDSLWQIAASHQADVNSIKAANGISHDDILRAGQVLRLPTEQSLAFNDVEAPRFALSSEGLVGSVGGDIPTLEIESSDVPALSLDTAAADLENPEALEDLENLQSDTLALADSEALELADEMAEPDEQLIAEAMPSESAESWTSAAVLEPQTAVIPAELEVTEEPTAEQPAPLAAAPDTPWQDASAQALALESSSSESASAAEVKSQGAVATTATSEQAVAEAAPSTAPAATTTASTSALPMSLALHDTPSRSQIPTAVSASPSQPPVSSLVEPPTVSSSALSVAEGNITLAEDGAATSLEVASSSQLAPTADPGTEAVSPTRSREEVIQDHLARIRESNGATINREALNERIRQARQELERSRNEVSTTPASAPSSSSSRTVSSSLARSTPEVAAPAISLPFERTTQASRSQAWTVTDAAVEVATSDTNDDSAQVAVLPQSTTTEADAANREVSLPNFEGDRLLAAAPLGADAYRPFPSVPTGQMVSPGMPMLPGSEEFLPDAPARFNGYVWPTRGTFTSGYGWRWGRMHRGIDVAGPVGTPIVAAASGTVVRSGWNSGGYGNLVDIRHPDGSLTRYAHNSRLLVREGEQVRQGQQIAEMGSTGYSTGPHLHFEIHLPGTGTVNPMAYLPGR